MPDQLQVKGFLETSFLDWDGKVVSTIFLPLCNFRCPFCHNSGLIETPENYDTVPLERIYAYLLEHRSFVDGVCVTGGEPCLHMNRGLVEFLRQLKDNGFLVKLDTNGSFPAALQRLLDENLVDYVAMDIKGPLDERYDRLTGIKTNLDKVKQSIALLGSKKIPYEFRTTIVPTLLAEADVADIFEQLKGTPKLILQQFVAENCWDESLRSLKPYAKEKLEAMARQATAHIREVKIRGV
ncbi:MAG: anaerobic ribonucleoside-triphosphate reductase activating protein [Candidatus Saganbacteria bacterium]|nr:anaerobic ribonucleoside-triphosphate reductase activating protein [Candidatus Saganbacteria bacterium]